MELETITLEHVPGPYAVHLALFRNVQNAEFLHKQLLSRNADFEYGFIDASVIVSRLHLLSAVFKAVSNAANNVLQTPNVHSEIVVSLSSSNNIAEAYRRYGVSAMTKDLLVIKVTEDGTPSSEQIAEHLKSSVKGESLPVSDDNIAFATNLTTVRKYYKLNGMNWLDGIKDQAEQRKEMELLVVSAMALRGN